MFDFEKRRLKLRLFLNLIGVVCNHNLLQKYYFFNLCGGSGADEFQIRIADFMINKLEAE